MIGLSIIIVKALTEIICEMMLLINAAQISYIYLFVSAATKKKTYVKLYTISFPIVRSRNNTYNNENKA